MLIHLCMPGFSISNNRICTGHNVCLHSDNIHFLWFQLSCIYLDTDDTFDLHWKGKHPLNSALVSPNLLSLVRNKTKYLNLITHPER